MGEKIEYKVLLHSVLHHDKKMVMLSHEIALPFVPFPGLSIDNVGMKSAKYVIGNLKWVLGIDRFSSRTDEVFESEEALRVRVSELQFFGWEIIASMNYVRDPHIPVGETK